MTSNTRATILPTFRQNESKTVLKVFLPYLLIWLGFMVVPTLAGQPEVICATPFGLILALAVGTGVVVGGRGGGFAMVSLNLGEAVSAGALVGAFQGLLLAVWLPIVMAMRETKGMSQQYENIEIVLMAALFLPAGILVGGLLGAILGAVGHGIRAFGDTRRCR